MNSEIKKIEDKIWSLINESHSEKVSKTVIRRKLSRQGYKLSDIESAINRVWEKRKGAKVKRISNMNLPRLVPTTFYLPDNDQLKLTDEAYCALQRLHYYQMLSPIDRIILLEQIDNVRGRIDLEKLVEIIETVLAERYPVENLKIIIAVAVGDNSIFM
ncbi:MAG: hypothetical protein ACP5UA_09540 [Candidatus Hydrogenedens sp.]